MAAIVGMLVFNVCRFRKHKGVNETCEANNGMVWIISIKPYAITDFLIIVTLQIHAVIPQIKAVFLQTQAVILQTQAVFLQIQAVILQTQAVILHI